MSLGIHHITAIASDPGKCVDFYTRVLGLRLVKKTVNQDQVEAYHLFFGDTTGEPGMDLTFFTFDPVNQGVRGAGVVSMISLAARATSLEFWLDRFVKHNVKHEALETRFGCPRITFFDPDDQRLELVGVADDEYQRAAVEVWTTDQVGAENAIAAFYSARLSVFSLSMVEIILTDVLGFQHVESVSGNLHLFQLPGASRAQFLEVEEHPEEQIGQSGAGTVHHIAFQVRDEKHLLLLRDRVLAVGLYPTGVIDRYYFKSVYFRTPAGILFELATNGPGFTADEPQESLGERLSLPPFLEPDRAAIEANLSPI